MANNINKTIQHLNNAIEKLQFDTNEDSIQKVLNELDKAKELLSTKEEIFLQWSYEDILAAGENIDIYLNKDEAIEVLQDLKKRHDASIGINWEVICAYLRYNFDEKYSGEDE